MHNSINTQKDLVNYLISTGVLKSQNVIEAFRKTDRKNFIPKSSYDLAYIDAPIPIGYGQTNSQPTTVAFMLELLDPKKGNKVLDIGSGSGWTSALLGCLIDKKGIVYGVERIPELVEFGKRNIERHSLGNVQIVQSTDILSLGAKGPFDRILVSAQADKLPKELITQLKVGGILVIPVNQSILRVIKVSKKEIKKEEYPGFVFVPLIRDDFLSFNNNNT